MDDIHQQRYERRKPILDAIREHALKPDATDIDRLAVAINLLAGAIYDSAVMLGSPQIVVDDKPPTARETLERLIRERKVREAELALAENPSPETFAAFKSAAGLASDNPFKDFGIERRQFIDHGDFEKDYVERRREQAVLKDGEPAQLQRRAVIRRAGDGE